MIDTTDRVAGLKQAQPPQTDQQKLLPISSAPRGSNACAATRTSATGSMTVRTSCVAGAMSPLATMTRAICASGSLAPVRGAARCARRTLALLTLDCPLRSCSAGPPRAYGLQGLNSPMHFHSLADNPPAPGGGAQAHPEHPPSQQCTGSSARGGEGGSLPTSSRGGSCRLATRVVFSQTSRSMPAQGTESAQNCPQHRPQRYRSRVQIEAA